MATRRPHVRTITVRCAPAKVPCPDCDKLGPRKATHNRLVRSIGILDDGMSIERVIASMRRDFLLDLSDGFVHDCIDWQAIRPAGLIVPTDRACSSATNFSRSASLKPARPTAV